MRGAGVWLGTRQFRRIPRWGSSPPAGWAGIGLDRDDPVRSHLGGKRFDQPVDETGTVLVEERHETNLAFLGVPARECLHTCVMELPAKGLVFLLCSLHDLDVQLLPIVLH